MEKTCAFCGAKGPFTKEHVIPNFLYKKYKGPLNKLSWCPVVIVNVFSTFNASIFCFVRSEIVVFWYCCCKTATKEVLVALSKLCFFAIAFNLPTSFFFMKND